MMASSAKRQRKKKRSVSKTVSARQRKRAAARMHQGQPLPSMSLHEINAARQVAKALGKSSRVKRPLSLASVQIVPYVVIYDGETPIRILHAPRIMDLPDGRIGVSIKSKVYPILSSEGYFWINRQSVHAKRADCVPRPGRTHLTLTAPIPSSPALEMQELLHKLPDEADRKFLTKRLQEPKPFPPKRPNKARLSAMIGNLETRSLQQLLGMWRNAIRALGGENKTGLSIPEIGLFIDAIEREWNRRGASTLPTQDYFEWPTTDAPVGAKGVAAIEAQDEGMLSYLEYRVGRTYGLPTKVRRAILERVFRGKLPPVFSRQYMDQWGQAGSPRRLQKTAECIAAFARNAKRRDDDRMDQAIREWEADLNWLHEEFYIGHFRFAWPSTRITV
jgi:hypothetical protein